MVRSALICIVLLASAGCTDNRQQLSGRWVDLTHDMAEDSPFWPTAEGFKHEVASYGQTPGGWFYSSYNLTLSEHGGTHLDAPIHFAEGKQTADQIPLDRLIGPAAVIDVSAASAAIPTIASPSPTWRNGSARTAACPTARSCCSTPAFPNIGRTGSAIWARTSAARQAVAKLHFPGLSEELARFLVEQRKVAAVGLDTPSLDYGQSKDFIVHRILLGANIPGFENVADLDLLAAKGAKVVALPAKIRGGSGAPRGSLR